MCAWSEFLSNTWATKGQGLVHSNPIFSVYVKAQRLAVRAGSHCTVAADLQMQRCASLKNTGQRMRKSCSSFCQSKQRWWEQGRQCAHLIPGTTQNYRRLFNHRPLFYLGYMKANDCKRVNVISIGIIYLADFRSKLQTDNSTVCWRSSGSTIKRLRGVSGSLAKAQIWLQEANKESQY